MDEGRADMSEIFLIVDGTTCRIEDRLKGDIMLNHLWPKVMDILAVLETDSK
jgi:hypothetical protein